MINEIGKTANNSQSLINNSRVIIYDARPWLSAEANRLMNGGFEKTKYYRNTEVIFCDIDNIHEPNKCTRKIQEIPNKPQTFSSMSLYEKTSSCSMTWTKTNSARFWSSLNKHRWSSLLTQTLHVLLFVLKGLYWFNKTSYGIYGQYFV